MKKKLGRPLGKTVTEPICILVSPEEKEMIDQVKQHYTRRQIIVAGAQFLLSQMRPQVQHKGADLP
jgi:hypothetical protein